MTIFPFQMSLQTVGCHRYVGAKYTQAKGIYLDIMKFLLARGLAMGQRDCAI